ncbi:YqcC family protein [Marinobacterium sp. MBR-109]|jgi:uncharacterized protein YqcC (DUF446 family)|uniref:YqcC family protein n=1 Tax=Marinobacterium sp. MBR-109 TaxID=3156462 RepID=UPI003399AEE5
MHRTEQVSVLLLKIRTEMEVLELWQSSPPSAEALASTQPFCVDTLHFTEWLQWLLIPRLQEMIRQELPLPQSSQIQPMAEEVFKQVQADTDRLLELIEQLDAQLSVHH